jgi:redox-sensing transcriptional repressor
MPTSIPDIVVSRLPVYHQTLQTMLEEGQHTTSSQELGERLGISAAQIRKDLSQFGEFGKQGTGYNIAFLLDQLKSILNMDRIWEVAIIGAGNLGHAIARYHGFAPQGFNIRLVFDSNPDLIGTHIDDLEVHDTQELIPRIKAAGIKLAMLTVPDEAAQEVAEELVKAGIQGILNYTSTPLILPQNIVHLRHSDPVDQLQHMTYYIGKNNQD